MNNSDSKPTVNLAPIAEKVKAASLAWEQAGISTRLKVLQEAGEHFQQQQSKFDECMVAMGLSTTLAKTYASYVTHMAKPDLLKMYAKDLVKVVEIDGGRDVMVRRADGLVLVCLPIGSASFNSVALFHIMLAGNAAIVCVHPYSNDKGVRFVIDEILRPALEKHGFSPDLIAMVTGDPLEVSDQFMKLNEANTIVYFGNWTNGTAMAKRAYEHSKKAVLELDGNDYMVVWKDAPLDKALASARSGFEISGLPCFLPRHFLVHESHYDTFLNGLVDTVSKHSATIAADPVDGVLLPIPWSEGYFAALDELKDFGKVHCGGYKMNADGTRNDESGPYLAPLVVSLDIKDCLNNSFKCLREEIFYPFMTVIRFSGNDEETLVQMSDLIKQSPFALRASVWSSTPKIIEHFTRQIGYMGMLRFNNTHSNAPSYASFWGGPKRSGGPYGELNVFWEKTTHLQAIDCLNLTEEEFNAVLTGLGYVK